MKFDEGENDAAATEIDTLQLRVTTEDTGARLDAYLATQIEDWSRSRIQRLIEDGDVLVNEQAAKSSYKLRADDLIEVELVDPSVAGFAPEDIPLDILYEDEYLAVVNKPAGMVVHPGAGNAGGTLANALAHHFQQLPEGGGPQRPGIVHRLDKDTSGLLVVAKTEAAHEHLSNQFREREVSKSYVALTHGRVKEESGRIEQFITRDPRHRTRMTVGRRRGRPALTLYRVRQRFDRFTLLDVEIKTGRTHQIRVHLQWLNHPVVGDETYGSGRDKTIPDTQLRAAISKLGRMFLHAEKLGFHHPQTGRTMRFKAPLPDELDKVLKLLE